MSCGSRSSMFKFQSEVRRSSAWRLETLALEVCLLPAHGSEPSQGRTKDVLCPRFIADITKHR